MTEIARRVGADVHVVEAEWGTVFEPEQVEAALKRVLAEARRRLPGRHLDHDGAAARGDRASSASATAR